MLGVMSSVVPMGSSWVIGVGATVVAVATPLGTTWLGVKPTVIGIDWPEKIVLTSLLAVMSKGVASSVTRFFDSSSWSRQRKLPLTTWNSRSLAGAAPSAPGAMV